MEIGILIAASVAAVAAVAALCVTLARGRNDRSLRDVKEDIVAANDVKALKQLYRLGVGA